MVSWAKLLTWPRRKARMKGFSGVMSRTRTRLQDATTGK